VVAVSNGNEAWQRQEGKVGRIGKYGGVRKRGAGVRAEVWSIFLMLILLMSPFVGGKEADADSLIKKGAQIPRFELPVVGGGKVKLQEELGRAPLLLLYWSLYCDICREDFPKIQKIVDRLGPSKVKALAINGDGKDAVKLVQGYWQRGRYTFVSLMDEELKDSFLVEGLLGVEKTPVAVVVSPKGIVLFSQEGKIDLAALEEAIRRGN
jgi:peroxiredoxin